MELRWLIKQCGIGVMAGGHEITRKSDPVLQYRNQTGSGPIVWVDVPVVYENGFPSAKEMVFYPPTKSEKESGIVVDYAYPVGHPKR